MKNRMKIVADPKLQVILEKCLDADRAMELCLFEGSISRLITEELDEADVKTVLDSLAKARKAATGITEYIGSLGVELPNVAKYVSGIDDALNLAQGELAKINFAGSNPVSQVWGGKVTLPRIIKTVATLYTKATDFTTGFTKAMNNIQTNLKSLAGDADLSGSLDQSGSLDSLAGKNGIPDINTLQSGIESALTKAIKGGYLTRISNFFGNGKIGGIEKKIMSAIPDIDAGMIKGMADAIMKVPLSKLFQPIPEADPNPSDDIGDASKEAAADLEQETPEAEASNADQDDAENTDDPTTPEDESEANDGPFVSKQAFIDLIKKSPRMTQSKRGGEKQRLKFKQAVNKAVGKTVFEEGLLTGPRRIKADKISDKDAETFNRWKNLAGVID